MCPVMEVASSNETYCCKLTSMVVDESEEMRYTTYGIAALDYEGQTVLAYPDISTDQAFVEEFLRMIDSHDIALIHIPELLEDSLE